MTYRVGSIGEFKAWTTKVIRDPTAAQGVPRKWADSVTIAERAAAADVSAEAMVKLLSPANLALLHVIGESKPGSLRRLAELTGRKESNLSRTLKRFERAGIVAFTPGPGRSRAPVLVASRVRLEIDLAGPDSTIAIEALHG